MIMFMLLHACISIIWSENVSSSLSTILNLVYVFIFVALFLNLCRDKKILTGTLISIGSNLLVICLFALFEIFTGIYLFNTAAGPSYVNIENYFGLHIPAVCFDNMNNLAFTICLSMPILFYIIEYLFSNKPLIRNITLALIFILTLFVLVQTVSFIGLITYALVCSLCLFIRIKNSKKMLAMLIIQISLSFMLCVGILVLFNTNIINSMPGFIREQVWSIKVRSILIERAITIMQNSYFLGVGQGNIDTLMMQTNIFQILQKQIYDIHEFYLELGAIFGIIPALFLIYIQIKTFFTSYKIIKLNLENKFLAMICLPMTIALIPASAMLSSSMFFYIMWMQFAIWSLFLYSENKPHKIE